MNTIDVMKQARDALEMWITPNWAGSGVDKANAAHAALEQAIQQEEANIQTQITKDILRPVKTCSGGNAWPAQMQWVEYETGNHTKRHWEWLNKQEEQAIKDNCTTVTCVLKSIKAKLKEKNEGTIR